jgi:hypothetical protein
VAVAEQVEEVCLVMQLPSGSPNPKTPKTLLHCHGGPSGWVDVPFIRPTSVIYLPTMLFSPRAREQAYHS